MKLFEALEEQLKKEPNFVSDDGELKKWVVLNKAQNFDEELISLLLDNVDLKDKFFIKVKNTLVFNQKLFSQFLEQKNYLNDSYTQYKNKIGLTINGKNLKQCNEVVLDWPFKDCILEGGQSREEQNRREIFFNEILAQDEITQLLEPKVLTNFKRIDKNKEKVLAAFNRDAELNNMRGLSINTITDNLIVKGNNLLALHTLKEEFFGKVKLIYIDPPYGKDADTFYNDSFKVSTWLTFMKNRLRAAKEMLTKDGVIFIQISYHNLAQVKLVADEIFNSALLNIITVKVRSASGFKVVNPGCFVSSEFILVYSKEKGSTNLKKSYVEADYDDAYSKLVLNKDKNIDKWEIVSLKDQVAKEHGYDSYRAMKKKLGERQSKNNIAEYALTHSEKICQLETIGHAAGKKSLKLKALSKKERNKVFQTENSKGEIRYILNGREMAFFNKKLRDFNGVMAPSTILSDIWQDISWEGIGTEGGVTLNRGKKPEKLLKRIIEISTNENDIVMDYHLGSGTTAAVAHKMKRQYIGIEQLDYQNNSSFVRLKNVINGDKTGVSEGINWQGGGSFVYLELKKYNETFIDQIEAAENTITILEIWEQMKAKSFINYNVDIKEQEKHLEEFKADSLENQKQLLLKLLDLNQLYVNLSSLNDKDFECSEEEKAITKDFYQIKN